ncbi:MAG: DUF2087 domain-containing protein [Pseudomonadales bacterium]
MAEWVHPDKLERISASGAGGATSTPGDRADIDRTLRRALVKGQLTRIPRHPGRRDLILATLCLRLRRRHPYTEIELNNYLRTRLERWPATLDHVTCRRYLVDLGFLKRDRAGRRYLLNYPRLEAVLTPEAATVAEAFLQCGEHRHAGARTQPPASADSLAGRQDAEPHPNREPANDDNR